MNKSRPAHDVAAVTEIAGRVRGKIAILGDDVIMTGGTMLANVRALEEQGASEVWLYATHGVFCGDALERFAESGIKGIVVTDTVPIDPLTKPDKLTVLPGVEPPRRDDHERLRRRLGLGDLRRREPALLRSAAAVRVAAVPGASCARLSALPFRGGRPRTPYTTETRSLYTAARKNRDRAPRGRARVRRGVWLMNAARALTIAMISLALAAALWGASAASSQSAAAQFLRFSTYPKRTLPGKTATLAITGPEAKDVCKLDVKYAAGPLQPGLRPITIGARPAVWTWKVPRATRPGAARVTVTCKYAGKLTGLFVIDALPLEIDVVNKGFSTRVRSGRATVTYGVVLANRSPSDDALDVFVLVNFVTASNVLIGTKSTILVRIPAGTEYNLGSSLSFPGAAPVNHVEVVVKSRDRQLAAHTPVPTISNIRIIPDANDTTWVDEIDADMHNGSNDLMSRATLSVVLFNAAGRWWAVDRLVDRLASGQGAAVREGDHRRRLGAWSRTPVSAQFTVVAELQSD